MDSPEHSSSNEHQSSCILFAQAWDSAMSPFNQWLSRVSEAYHRSRMNLEQAALLVGAREAEVWAALRLASMNEEALALLDQAPLPRTTWLHLPDCNAEAVKVALKVLEGRPTRGKPAASVVREALDDYYGPATEVSVSNLPSKTIGHMAEKQEQYDGGDGWTIKFLKSISRQKRTGKVLSLAQGVKLKEVLKKMADSGYIRRDSPDGDVSECNEVLDALGM